MWHLSRQGNKHKDQGMTSIQDNIHEIRAEVLLNYLYPEMMERWVANCKGTFYRNYSEDIMRINEESGWVNLSRNGMLKLLPQGLITTERELKGKDFKGKYEELRRRRGRLEDMLRPFDTRMLRRGLKEEARLAELLENRLDTFLKTYFHIDRSAEKNIYIRQMMALLPMVSRRRGDIRTLCDVLQVLLGHRVTMQTGIYNWSEHRRDAQPMVEYRVWMPSLANEEYNEIQKQVEQLQQFLQEWFIPFDTKCLIELKCNRPASLGMGLTLNYNTRTDEEH